MSATSVKFSKVYPEPAYDGPQPVYVATFPWAGAQRCYVRRNGKVWETAELVSRYGIWYAKFSACPIAGASATRHAAVMAFDYYYNRDVMS